MKLQKSHNIDSIFLPAVHAINNVVLDVVNLKYYKQSVPEKVTFIMLLDRSAAGRMIILTIFTHTRSESNDLTSQAAILKSLFWIILYLYKA